MMASGYLGTKSYEKMSAQESFLAIEAVIQRVLTIRTFQHPGPPQPVLVPANLAANSI